MADWIPFGRLTRAHGVRGELRLIPYSFADDLPETVECVRVGGDREHTLTAVRTTNDAYLVTLAGIDDRTAAERLAGRELEVRRCDLPPLEPGEFFLYELVGAELVDEAGQLLGRARGISQTGGQDILVVDAPQGERLLSLGGGTVVHFDRDRHRLVVRLVTGIWD